MPSEWQSASAGKGRTNILCVLKPKFCLCQEVLRVWYFTSFSISRGTNAATLSSSTGFSCSLMEQTPPLPSSTPSLDRSLNTMCHLDVFIPSASTLKFRRQVTMEPQTEIERQRRRHSEVDMDTHLNLHARTESAVLHCAPSFYMDALRTHTQSQWHWWSQYERRQCRCQGEVFVRAKRSQLHFLSAQSFLTKRDGWPR